MKRLWREPDIVDRPEGRTTDVKIKKGKKRRQEGFGVVTKDEPKPKKVTLNAG